MNQQLERFAPAVVRRHNIYGQVHRGLRLAHGRMLVRIGATDPDDLVEIGRMASELRGHLAMCRSHLDHEDAHIHTALEARKQGASRHAEEGHDDHLQAFGEIEAWLAQVERSGFCGRADALAGLYRRFALFVAHDIEHMDVEETELQGALEEAFSDDEIRAIEGRIIAAITPDMMARFMAAMLPAMNPRERRETLAGMKAGMPAEVFAGFIETVVRPCLSADDLDALGPLVRQAA